MTIISGYRWAAPYIKWAKCRVYPHALPIGGGCEDGGQKQQHWSYPGRECFKSNGIDF